MCPTADPMPNMTSFVQVRGSIPFFWFQQASIADPVPTIVLDK